MKRFMLIAIAAAAVVLAAAGICFAEPVDRNGDGQGEVQDNGIPVVTITIDEEAGGEFGTIDEMNSSEHHTAVCIGTVDIHVPEGFRTEYGDTQFADMTGMQLEYIRGRGNSTWASIKKPYKCKFASGQDLFGMGKNKHWVLLANHFDPTKSRNRLTYWLGKEIGMEYTPQGVPVDLRMRNQDGTYDKDLGSYYLCEQVRIGNSRVAIDELKNNMTTEPEITGGYLLSFSELDDARDGYLTERENRFCLEDPTWDEELNDQQYDYICGFLQDTEDAIFAEEYDHDAVAAKMDLQSAADYWWLQAFSSNGDAYGTGSTYLYKKRNGKLYWGPLWDFDLAWNNEEESYFNISTAPWIEHLMECDPEFQQLLAERWEVLSGKLDELTAENGVLDQYREQIRASWENDYAIYGTHTYNWEDEAEEDIDYDAEFKLLRSIIEKRQAFVETHLNFIIAGCNVTYMADGEVIKEETVKFGEKVYEPPVAPEKEGYLFSRWLTEDGKSIEEVDIIEDTVFIAKYVTESEATKATQLFISQYDQWVPLEAETLETEVVVLPEDADDRRVQWSSSDESVATVDKKGVLTLKGLGHADITGTLTSGATNTYRVHVYDSDGLSNLADGKPVGDTSELVLKVGERDQFRWHVEPRDELNTLMTLFKNYEISDEKIAEVDDYGIVHGIKEGTTTLRLEVEGLDNVKKTLECPVKVVSADSAPISIDNAAVTLAAASYTYNGKVRKPAVKTVGGMTLAAGTDFDVSYSAAAPKNVGQYTVTVTGKGKYTGTAKAAYRINPKGTAIKKVKRGKKSLTVKWKKQRAKMSKKRVTGYQIQVATDKNFKSVVKTVKVKGWKKTSKRIKGLKKKTRYFTRARAYVTTGGVTCYSKWSKTKKARTR